MKKRVGFLALLLICISCVFSFVACGNKEIKFDLSFMVDDVVYAKISTSGHEAIEMPEDPEKADYEFAGWYWDRDTWQNSFTFNSLINQPLTSNMCVYARFISEGDYYPTSIALNETELNFGTGETFQLQATVYPETAFNKSVIWQSSNSNVVSVSNTGLVTGVSVGEATITAKTKNNLTATCNVTVVNGDNVVVSVVIDGVVVNTITTNYRQDYKITAPQKPEDITTNPNAQRYFYGWFVDSNFQTPLTEDRIFTTNSRIYGKWYNVYSNNFGYTVSKGKATINYYYGGTETVVVIPCYINSFPVERIAASTFANRTMLRNVIICDGIEYIDNNAFDGCNSMESIQLPNTLKEIGESAFENCELLKKVEFPESLEKINKNAFKSCSTLDSATLIGDWWVTSDTNYIFERMVEKSTVAQDITTNTSKIFVSYPLFEINYHLNGGSLEHEPVRFFL